MTKPHLEPPWWFAPAVAMVGLVAAVLMLVGVITVIDWMLGQTAWVEGMCW